MTFRDRILGQPRPDAIRAVDLPRRQTYYPSPGDWRDEILYFLLPDRFSDGQEGTRPLLDRGNLAAARPNQPNGQAWQWAQWADSGASRWQGGTIKGIESKLNYLRGLGANAIWVGPVFKQRGHLDTYHGYGVQDFLDVDPRFGNRQDLVDLVNSAHAVGLRIILDVIFNHSGSNWLYPAGTSAADPNGDGRFQARYTEGRYPFGAWRGDQGQEVPAIQGSDAGAWPTELQQPDDYTRAGSGSLDATPAQLEDPEAEHKRSDFSDLRDFNLDDPNVLTDLALCYKYWIALTDCDGFRIDTLKHVSFEQARNFCGAIKEFTSNLGKSDFFLVGEIGGGDYNEARYLNVLQRNLNAALDIGEMRPALCNVAKGLAPAEAYFDGFDPNDPARLDMGSHRILGEQHVSVLDDHDHVFGDKLRFSVDASSNHQVVAGVAIQLFSLGIPCIYYGTEQAFAGPEQSERQWLPSWGGGDSADRYLREAMFGPEHPRLEGRAGLPAAPAGQDPNLPGFGPFGTAGQHCFDTGHAAYMRIAALAALRASYPVLRYGRQYVRPISLFNGAFTSPGSGEIVAWSRILDDEEALCVVNSNGADARGADILVDARLNPAGSSMTVIANTAEVAATAGGAGAYGGTHPVGSVLPVQRKQDGTAFVQIRNVAASEALVLTNRPVATT